MNDETITRKIPVEDVTSALRADWKEIRKELREILRSYDIPEKYEEKVLNEIKENVKKKLEGLPYNDKLCDALTKLYIRVARILLCIEEDRWWVKEETTLSKAEVEFIDKLIGMGLGNDRDSAIRLCVLFAYFKLKEYEGRCPFPPTCDKCKVKMKIEPPHSYEGEEWEGWMAVCPKCQEIKYADKIGDRWVGG